ncbi:riboflavin kinase / FMN adenylyltransferase [Tenacibaculum sp. MAR_2009_124]|uniref:bifunctional riboflavin kinase/FAD synthetase n=1 Tax=Tenacibaculum sp. MAR_2009_124 TaxID=1250059 RepID=UPI00089A5C78|nr:bifunctional riboflavin kinase/FAD synthetase [Tenacibaculum sp. MAR_2009_124]SEC34520.1 riboflavin kinase / FMN adenylyltransferase [Tenacibaculum sp. MAR_2009_124]
MEVTHSIFDFNPSQKTYVTIGTFDGVHIGHQKIIKKLIEDAKLSNKKSVVLTFFPHPRMVLQQDVTIQLINTIQERTQQLESLGLDYLIIHPFDREFSRLTALDFVRDVLVNKLNIDKLIIGYDHHFGKNREGNIEQLTEYSHLYDFNVEEIPAQDIDDVSVSSTKIRNALLDGQLKVANNYLGYNFSLSGKIVSGEQLGQKIGFPTANIHIEEDYKLIPKTGAYVVKSTVNSQLIFGMMNIGVRPTVNGNNRTIEVHFFDFDANIYHQQITVELLYFLRDEQKFNSVNELKEQLEKDKRNAGEFLKSYANF